MGIRERRERERERRRQQIIIAARRVFAAKGLGKATMEDIAREAELSPGTLYVYFKNKNELYASLSIRILKHLDLRLKHVGDAAAADASNCIDELKRILLDVHTFDPLILLNMFQVQSREALENLSPELRDQIARLSASIMGRMAEIFRAGIQRGDFIDKPPATMADVLWALFSGIVLWEDRKRIIHQEAGRFKPTFEAALDIFQQGICKNQYH